MLSKCANPVCMAPFRYLREGKIFNIPVCDSDSGFSDRPNRVEHFWLCRACAATLKVVWEKGAPVVRSRFPQLPAPQTENAAKKTLAAEADSTAA